MFGRCTAIAPCLFDISLFQIMETTLESCEYHESLLLKATKVWLYIYAECICISHSGGEDHFFFFYLTNDAIKGVLTSRQ